jgi:hypothetical protein
MEYQNKIIPIVLELPGAGLSSVKTTLGEKCDKSKTVKKVFD